MCVWEFKSEGAYVELKKKVTLIARQTIYVICFVIIK